MRGAPARPRRVWDDVTVTNVYTVHDVNALLAAEILPRIGPAARHGVTWHYTRPPIVSIEYEMDLRGCSRESTSIPVT